MKGIMVLCLSFLSCYTFGQDQKHKPVKPISIGFNFSPDITSRRLPGFDYRDKDETSKFGYTTGLIVSFPINNTLYFETGLQYSNKGYRTIKKGLIAEQPDPSIPTNTTFIYTYRYLDVPTKLSLILGKNKVRFTSGLGVVTNILLNQTTKSIFEFPGRTDTRTEPSTYNNKKINISPVISAGVDVKLNSSTNLRVEPTFRYGLWQPYLWAAGMNVGYYRSL